MRKYLFLLTFLMVGCEQPIPNSVPTTNPISILTNVTGTILDNTHTVPTNLIKAYPAPILDLANSPFANSTPNPAVNYMLESGPTENTGPINPDEKSIVTKQDNGGQSGFFIFRNDITGLYANNTAYPGLELNPASSSAPYNYLYAPTTRLGNGACLEYSMDYYRSATSDTYRYLRLFNFCNGVHWNTGVQKVVDANFQDNYLRDLGPGVPQYTIEIIKDIQNYTRLFLYNYKNQNWELIYTTKPTTDYFQGGETWSMFETHYTDGQCSIVPPIVSSNIEVLSNGKWESVDYNSTDTVWGDCFTGDNPTNRRFVDGDDSWIITSN